MSEKIKDGGPAFPHTDSMDTATRPGMTLRDYFAAHSPLPTQNYDLKEHCAFRFRYADAMLAEREKGGESC